MMTNDLSRSSSSASSGMTYFSAQSSEVATPYPQLGRTEFHCPLSFEILDGNQDVIWVGTTIKVGPDVDLTNRWLRSGDGEHPKNIVLKPFEKTQFLTWMAQNRSDPETRLRITPSTILFETPKGKWHEPQRKYIYQMLRDSSFYELDLELDPSPRERKFENCTFFFTDFTLRNYKDITFKNCSFVWATLSFENDAAVLENVKFVDCSMKGVDFSSCKLKNSYFENCNLEKTNFSQADLTDAHFNNCRMSESNLSEIMGQGIFFKDCDLSQAKMDESYMLGSQFTRTDLRNTSMQDVCLDRSSFLSSTLEGADLRRAQAYSLTTDRCQLVRVDVRDANLCRIRSMSTDFFDTDLDSCLTREAEFSPDCSFGRLQDLPIVEQGLLEVHSPVNDPRHDWIWP